MNDDPGPSSRYYARFAPNASGPLHAPLPADEPMLGGDADPQEFLDAHAADSLYAILNVERTASAHEIKDRYRALAAVYHPDKQPDEARRRAAHARFTAIQRAYEVLADEQRRTIYDLFGEEGLRTKWEVGPRNMSKAAMRLRFLKEDERRRRMDAAALVDSKSDMSVTVDARGVFLPKQLIEDPEGIVPHDPISRLQRAQTGQVVMRHSFETPINESTQFMVEGSMAARGGAGGANISGTIKHQFSPRLWMQFSQTCIAPRITTVKGTYTFDEFTYLNATAISQMWVAPPRLSLSLGRRIYPETTGFITYNTGFWALGPWGRDLDDAIFLSDQSALSIGATTARMDGSGWTTELTTGLAANGLSADWSTVVAGLRLKFGSALDFGGASVFADASGRVTEHTRAGAQLSLRLGGAVTLKLTVSRLGQKLALPILMSHYNNPWVVLLSAVLPTAGYAALHHYYLLPRKHAAIAGRIRELQKEHAEYTAQKRTEALEAQMAMERVLDARVAAERRRNGLIILDAKYGRADAFTARGYREVHAEDGGEAIVDVTIALQMLVDNSRLYIPAGRAKHGLNGFYDPCIGENKKLRVRYLFRGLTHEVTIDDVAPLRAPVQAHALE